MPGPVVVQTAMCMCAAGVAPTPLTVTSQMIVKINGLLVATIQDNKPGANIAPFGTCNILTASASGVPTPCAPATVAPWAPGAITTKIGGVPVLTVPATLNCTIGGVITITVPGQTTEMAT